MKARVKMNNEVFDAFDIQRGVTQGTLLRLLIFNTFVSDFEASLMDSTMIRYANDMSIVINLSNKDPESY